MEDTIQVDLWSKVTGAPERCQRVGVTSFKKIREMGHRCVGDVYFGVIQTS